MIKPILVIILLISSFFPETENFDRKINKEISKLWDKDNLSRKEIKFEKEANFNLYSISYDDSIIGYSLVQKVNSCRVGGCNKPSTNFLSTTESYENFYYLAIFDYNLVIQSVKVLEYNATHGHEICAKRWLRQFIGSKGCELKYGHEIDAISGATISGIGITNSINTACQILNQKRQQGLL